MPKISVLIPLYNRKIYAEECINSVLQQTFQDFEIIIRDDCSTDGVFEFVQKKFSAQISAGKIKLLRNEKNLGEAKTCNRLFRDVTGKYFTILHNDDFYLPHALNHLYAVAEKVSADVVHGSYYFTIPLNGGNFIPTCSENDAPEKIKIVSAEPQKRFLDWLNWGTFHDAQYNLYNRKFILDNEIFFDELECESLFFMLWWIMLAKTFVKTPVIFYVKRDALDSQTFAENFLQEKFAKSIAAKIEMSRLMDKLFDKVEFFKNNPFAQYSAKAHIFFNRDRFDIKRRKIYEHGITPEIFQAAENVFKKYFGENYFYPMFLFHWAHTKDFEQFPDVIKRSEKIVERSFDS